ncbi:hypothetical protein FUA48_15185 [Flavobacterium alkalisoli]|uniref:Uncharacterized protein n=1 Tax=Flavobacterium alkalisoli TaxID=2602769 RepID=A0A5B9G0K3_9FLAO|nr:hypothetical protein [Flavobacterium alkalisoli]QEE50872.1 hypothetical protein FUA48_15185 [Flavobacterium alkalisoli]
MKTKLLFMGLFAALILSSCANEENQNTSDLKLKAEDNNSLAILQSKALNDLRQQFVFDAGEERVSFKSKSGVKIDINTSTLRVKGNPVSGPVVVEYIEIFGRGDMLTANKTASGISNQSENQEAAAPLVTGGEFYVNMTTEEGENIDDGAEYQLTVPTELTGGDDEDMTSWTGEEEDTNGDGEGDDDGDVTWDEDTDENGDDKDVPVEEGAYILTLDRFGWCNIDKLEQFGGEKTNIFVDVPNGFDNHNSKVYIAFDGQINMMFRIDDYDNAAQLFQNINNVIPLGVQCHVIFASGQGNQWLYAVKSLTTVPNGVVVFTQGDIVTATQNDVINMLNSLP